MTPFGVCRHWCFTFRSTGRNVHIPNVNWRFICIKINVFKNVCFFIWSHWQNLSNRKKVSFWFKGRVHQKKLHFLKDKWCLDKYALQYIHTLKDTVLALGAVLLICSACWLLPLSTWRLLRTVERAFLSANNRKGMESENSLDRNGMLGTF
jgi:hypothetical protein